MTPHAYSELWPCDLSCFTPNPEFNVSASTSAFFRDYGWPRFFQTQYTRINFRPRLTLLGDECANSKIAVSPKFSRWLILADVEHDIGDAQAYICLDGNEKVQYFSVVPEEDDGLAQLVALSVWDMGNCMLAILEWNRSTSGSLKTGEAVMKFLRLINRTFFSLDTKEATCPLCQSAAHNSANTFWFWNIIGFMYDPACNGSESFPEEIDIAFG